MHLSLSEEPITVLAAVLKAVITIPEMSLVDCILSLITENKKVLFASFSATEVLQGLQGSIRTDSGYKTFPACH